MTAIRAYTPAARPLTPREHRFVAAYMEGFNGTQAAIRSGYSVNGASNAASMLLRRPPVAAALVKAEEAQEAAERARENKELAELRQAIRADNLARVRALTR
jgi:phage terminase small subunit